VALERDDDEDEENEADELDDELRDESLTTI
jgi:hypothetical protein